MKPHPAELLLLAVLAVLAVLVPFARVGGSGYVYDDSAVLEDNRFVTGGEFRRIWRTSYWAGTADANQERLYRPFFLTLAAVTHSAPRFVHLLAILAHTAAGCLLWLVLRTRLPGAGAGAGLLRASLPALGAGLFLFHPASVEVAAQGVGLMETLPLLLGVCAILLVPQRPGLAVILAALAPGWKEIGHVWLAGASVFLMQRRRIAWGIAGAAASAGWLLARQASTGQIPAAAPHPLANPLVAMGCADGVWSRIALVGHQVRLTLWPSGLSSDYSRGTLPLPGYPLQPWVLLGLGLLCFLAWQWRRLGAVEAVALATVLPTLDLTGGLGMVFAERFGYGFRFGLLLFLLSLVAPALERMTTPRVRAALAALAAVAILCGALSWRRYGDWSSRERLFRTDALAHPANAKLRYNRGLTHVESRRWAEAREEFAAAVRLAPDYPQAYFGLGIADVGLGDFTAGRRSLAIAAAAGVQQAAEQLRRMDLMGIR